MPYSMLLNYVNCKFKPKNKRENDSMTQREKKVAAPCWLLKFIQSWAPSLTDGAWVRPFIEKRHCEKEEHVAKCPQQDPSDSTQMGKWEKGRVRDYGIEGGPPTGAKFTNLSRASTTRWEVNIHLQSTDWWQAPQINTRSGILSISRMSAWLHFFTSVDIRNNCIHELA